MEYILLPKKEIATKEKDINCNDGWWTEMETAIELKKEWTELSALLDMYCL